MRPDASADLTPRLVRAARRRQPARHRVERAVLAGLAAMVCMAPTTTERIEPLAAIGRLDFAGFEDDFHCTATLIAPGRAITAAHCLDPPATTANVRFRPVFTATQGTEELRLARWQATPGERDVALLCLSTTAHTIPIPRAAHGPRPDEGLTVIGYAIPAEHRQRHDGCTVDAVLGDGSFVLNCPLRPGESGAPVLRHTKNGREIVGIVAATSNSQSLAWDVSADAALPECD